MLVPRGMGDDTNPMDVLSGLTLGQVTGQVPGFLSQQVGPVSERERATGKPFGLGKRR
jgi:hypothetical protein